MDDKTFVTMTVVLEIKLVHLPGPAGPIGPAGPTVVATAKRVATTDGPVAKKSRPTGPTQSTQADPKVLQPLYSNASGSGTNANAEKTLKTPNKKGPKCSVKDCKNEKEMKRGDASGWCKRHIAKRDEPHLVCSHEKCLKARQGSLFCKLHDTTLVGAICPTCKKELETPGTPCNDCTLKI